MRVAAYAQVSRTWQPTGVGKHIIQMIRGLANSNRVDLEVLSPRARLEDFGRLATGGPFAGLVVRSIPWPRWLLEKSWALVSRPRVDTWCNKPDWVYCPSEVYVPSRVAKTAVTIHCVNWFEPELPWYNAVATRSTRRALSVSWRPVLRKADIIFTVSEFLKARLIALMGIEERRIHVVGNGVEECFFEAAASPPGRSCRPQPYVVVVGGLTERKGGAAVIHVAKELGRRSAGIDVVVVGISEPRFATALPNVKHVGYLSSESGLPQLIRGAIALLFLSRYDTFGIPAAEAMAVGTPAIVSRYAGLPEVVGDAGIVVDMEQPKEIADIIIYLHRHESKRRTYIDRGQERASRFRWSVAVERAISAMRGLQ